MKLLPPLFGLYLNTLSLISKPLAGKLGFRLFCRPFAPSLKKHQLAYLNSATHRGSFRFKGKQVSCYEWGTGKKKILFLHGWQSHSYIWKSYIEGFDQNEYRLIAIDAPAHGASEGRLMNVPIYVELIEHVLLRYEGIDAIVGHSIGGFSALHYYFENPLKSNPPLAILAAPGRAEDFFIFFRDLIKMNERTEKAIRVYFKEWTGNEVAYYDTHSYGEHLNGPGLIIHDKQDPEVALHYAERLHESWTNSSLHVTSGLGHRLKSEEVVDLTVQFVIEKTKDE